MENQFKEDGRECPACHYTVEYLVTQSEISNFRAKKGEKKIHTVRTRISEDFTRYTIENATITYNVSQDTSSFSFCVCPKCRTMIAD